MTEQLLSQPFALTAELLAKYNIHGPRYTSYPTAPVWNDAFTPEHFSEAIGINNQTRANNGLSLYVHIPFCESRCLFCGCNVVITRRKEEAERYLEVLFKEIQMQAKAIHAEAGGKSRQVVQLHWGGGTPTYLSPEQMERLFRFQREQFQFAEDAEISIEVDPRVTTTEQIQLLKTLGFNRISFGVQDFDPRVQETIHRIQPIEMTEQMSTQCRTLGFDSINFDLIYGLPYQSVASFTRTLEEVIRLSPDRIALYNYAYVPWMSPHQNQIPAESLPEGPVKVQIFQTAIQRLTEAGYVYIGMDHFAKPTDELTLAQQEGTLRRNFMGYTTKAGSDLYAAGVSAISGLHGAYAQNAKQLSAYYQAIENGHFATIRGYTLTEDDHLRREVITAILCDGKLSFEQWHPSSQEQTALRAFEADGLIQYNEDGFVLTPLGRIFSRNIAMLFDAHLKPTESDSTANSSTTGAKHPLFSKTL